ncbi:MAG: glycosyltransferase family 2 protein [Anaerolineales bacterium]
MSKPNVSPAISVIMPVYNSAPYLRQAVESALAQPETLEVILVDDGSTDESWALCQTLAADYPRVQAYQHPDAANHGPGATRNLGFAHSQGEFITFMDSDDYYPDGAFEHSLQRLMAESDITGTHGILQNVEPDGRMGTVTRLPADLDPHHILENVLTQRVKLMHTTFIVRRGFLEQWDAPYATDLIMGEDHFFSFRAVYYGRFVVGDSQKPMVIRRRHSQSITVSSGKQACIDFQRRWAFCRRLWEWAITEPPLVPKRDLFLSYFVDHITAKASQQMPVYVLWKTLWPWAQSAITADDLRRDFWRILFERHVTVLENHIQASRWAWLYRALPKPAQYKLKRWGIRWFLRWRGMLQ